MRVTYQGRSYCPLLIQVFWLAKSYSGKRKFSKFVIFQILNERKQEDTPRQKNETNHNYNIHILHNTEQRYRYNELMKHNKCSFLEGSLSRIAAI